MKVFPTACWSTPLHAARRAGRPRGAGGAAGRGPRGRRTLAAAAVAGHHAAGAARPAGQRAPGGGRCPPSGHAAPNQGRQEPFVLPRALSRAAGPENFRRFLFDKFGYSRYSPDFPQLCDGTVLCRDPLEDQQRLLQAIVRHWTQGAGSRGNPDRAQALATVCPAGSVDAAVEHLTERTGMRPRVVASSASWPAHKHAPPAALSGGCVPHVRRRPRAAVAGTAQGLAPRGARPV